MENSACVLAEGNEADIFTTVNHFANQISRKCDPLRYNYCVLARIMCHTSTIIMFLRFKFCEVINSRKIRLSLMLAKHSSMVIRIKLCWNRAEIKARNTPNDMHGRISHTN